jgi:hypothetical protein
MLKDRAFVLNALGTNQAEYFVMNQRWQLLSGGGSIQTTPVGWSILALVISLSQLPALAQTWILTTAPSTNWFALATSSDGTRVFAVAGGYLRPSGPIFISTNSGVTWTQSSAPVTNWTQIVCSADGTIVHASAQSAVYSSTNSGATWDTENLTPNYAGRWQSLACSADGRMILATHNLESTNGWLTEIFVSTNRGATWTDSLLNGESVLAAAVSADGTQIVCSDVVSDGWSEGIGMVISTNTGQTWVRGNPQFWAPSLACSASGKILAGAVGIIYVSTNSGSSWLSKFGVGSTPYPTIACSADGSHMAAVGLTGIWTSMDTGNKWSLAALSSSPPLLTNRNVVVSSADGCRLYASIEGVGIYTSQARPSSVLRTAATDSSLMLSWIVPSAPLVLQQASDLTSGDWKTVPVTPRLNYSSLEYQVRVANSQGMMFYRLVSP